MKTRWRETDTKSHRQQGRRGRRETKTSVMERERGWGSGGV